MARQIYRQEALERLSSPEQLDMLMPVTSARGWIALAGVGCLLLTGMFWSVLGTMETTVDGDGLLMRYGGFEWVDAHRAGTVASTLKTEGDTVKAGDVMLRVLYQDENGEVAEDEIRSPIDGRVLDVSVMEGAFVQEGTPLVSIESPDVPLQAVVYVLAGDGYRVEKGMPVHLEPATESGRGVKFLSGTVTSAARFPASRSEMMYSLQSEDWANDFLSRGPVLEIVVAVEGKSSTLLNLYSGTPCRAAVTVQTRKPIELLVPNSGGE